MRNPYRAIGIIAVVACCSPVQAFSLKAEPPGGGIYTLYYANPLAPDQRAHVASFDTGGGSAFNRDNCELAAELFEQRWPGKARFWCEPGTYIATLHPVPQPSPDRGKGPPWACFVFNGEKFCE